jgi:hypothetical protein
VERSATSSTPTAPSAKPPRDRAAGIVPAATAVVWIAALVLGFAALESHSGTPGERGPAPAAWPAKSTLSRAVDGSTLLLFAHPKCPCTNATMSELEVLLARVRPARTVVVFVRPSGVSAGWERTALVERAERVSGVTVRVDDGGRESLRFGAKTSGTVLVYDATGSLRFSGGITGSRGHAGDNAGRSAAEAAVAGRDGAPASAVFGCPLLSQPCAEEVACRR